MVQELGHVVQQLGHVVQEPGHGPCTGAWAWSMYGNLGMVHVREPGYGPWTGTLGAPCPCSTPWGMTDRYTMALTPRFP